MPVVAVPPDASPPPGPTLVDATVPPATAGQVGWEYQRVVDADLDGDGTQERAVVIANVLMSQGQPLWDHGHTWHVYVETQDGLRTDVYRQFLPNGMLEATLTTAAPGDTPRIVLTERTPFELHVYDVRYDGPGRGSVVELVGRMLDRTTNFAVPP